MTAREMFKGVPIKGSVLIVSKGGYRGNFAYRISRSFDKKNYIVEVISDVNPKEYTVSVNPDTTFENLKEALDPIETAILYNEWKARAWENEKKRRISCGEAFTTEKMLEEISRLPAAAMEKGVEYTCYSNDVRVDQGEDIYVDSLTVLNGEIYCNYAKYKDMYPFNPECAKNRDVYWSRITFIKDFK